MGRSTAEGLLASSQERTGSPKREIVWSVR